MTHAPLASFIARALAARHRRRALPLFACAAGRAPRERAGQAGRAQALELGAGAASAQPGADRLGRRHHEGLERHDHGDALSVRAARQGVRPLRHGQGRHRRLRLHQPRLPARPLPGDGRRRPALHLRQRQGRLGGDRRLVPAVRRQGDEGRQVLLRLHPRSRHLPQQEEAALAERRQGPEGAPGDEHDRPDGHAARRHQRAGLGARGARRARARRRRRDHLPVGLDHACSASTRPSPCTWTCRSTRRRSCGR